MAKAKKLPSGSWRVLVYSHTNENGKRKYESFTADTKKEAEYLAAQFSAGHKTKQKNKNISFQKAMTDYISSRKNILSPSTIRGYEKEQRSHLCYLAELNINDITSEKIQKLINELSGKGLSSKTIRSAVSLAVTCLKANDIYLNTGALVFPKRSAQAAYLPTDDDIKKIMERIKGTTLELPVMLSAFGSLRRSELCALTSDDIVEGGVIVNKAKIKNSVGKYEIINRGKTASSVRIAALPEFVIEKLRKDGAVQIEPDTITKRFLQEVKAAGVTPFNFHMLRHYWASVAYAIGMPDLYIMQNGGWSTMDTPRKVYISMIDDVNNDFRNKINNRFEKYKL